MGKSVKIFDFTRTPDSSIYSLALLEGADSSIAWNEYFNSLSRVGRWLEEVFPLLSYHHLPTFRPSLSFISGELIPSEELGIYGTDTAIKKHIALPVFVVIPVDFAEAGIKIYDSTRRILWDKIPYDIQHRFWLKDKGFTQICSHHKDDLINLTPKEVIINCLQSAWHLYTEYRRYEKTGEFDLKCHPHGEQKNGRK